MLDLKEANDDMERVEDKSVCDGNCSELSNDATTAAEEKNDGDYTQNNNSTCSEEEPSERDDDDSFSESSSEESSFSSGGSTVVRFDNISFDPIPTNNAADGTTCTSSQPAAPACAATEEEEPASSNSVTNTISHELNHYEAKQEHDKDAENETEEGEPSYKSATNIISHDLNHYEAEQQHDEDAEKDDDDKPFFEFDCNAVTSTSDDTSALMDVPSSVEKENPLQKKSIKNHSVICNNDIASFRGTSDFSAKNNDENGMHKMSFYSGEDTSKNNNRDSAKSLVDNNHHRHSHDCDESLNSQQKYDHIGESNKNELEENTSKTEEGVAAAKASTEDSGVSSPKADESIHRNEHEGSMSKIKKNITAKNVPALDPEVSSTSADQRMHDSGRRKQCRWRPWN